MKTWLRRFLALLGTTAILWAALSAFLSEPTSTPWRASYFSNPYLMGTPDAVVFEPALNHNWGFQSALPILPPDMFSARWDSTLKLNRDSDVRFVLRVSDGARIFVDGLLVIDSWIASQGQVLDKKIPLTRGAHPVVVEFFDRYDEAVARLSVTADPGTVFFDYSSSYSTNSTQSGAAD